MSGLKLTIKRTLARLAPSCARDNVILAYHSIGNGSRFSQRIDRFEEQMSLLAHQFAVVPLDVVLAGRSVADVHLAAITFDDGFEDLYTCAFPVLKKWGFPFTVFLATGFLQRGPKAFEWSPHYKGLRPLTWEQVREMTREGCTVGSHTHSHPRLSECTPQQILEEFTRSKSILEVELGTEVDTLAYPFGQPHDYDRRAVTAAAAAGYRCAFTALQTSVPPDGAPFEIPRITIDAGDDREDFIQKVTGRRNFVAHVERLNSTLIRMGLRSLPVAAPSPSAAGL